MLGPPTDTRDATFTPRAAQTTRPVRRRRGVKTGLCPVSAEGLLPAPGPALRSLQWEGMCLVEESSPSSLTLSSPHRPLPTRDPHSLFGHHPVCPQASGSRECSVTCASALDVLLAGRIPGETSELLGRYGAHSPRLGPPGSPGRGCPLPSLASAPVTRALTSRQLW